jgi:hypothetical protein
MQDTTGAISLQEQMKGLKSNIAHFTPTQLPLNNLFLCTARNPERKFNLRDLMTLVWFCRFPCQQLEVTNGNTMVIGR